MRYKQKAISRFHLPSSGLWFNAELETIMACRWRGISDTEFEAMDVEGQIRTIAAYRTITYAEAVVQQETAREQERLRKRSHRR